MTNWYEKLGSDNGLRQGELVRDCDILIPPSTCSTTETISIDVESRDIIVLTQSCDIESKGVDFLLVAQWLYFEKYIELLETGKTKNDNFKRERHNVLRKGQAVSLHMLKRDTVNQLFDEIVVDFTKVYPVHRNVLLENVKRSESRICLCSPYLEHLSQSFARYFMRVGLPSGIPELKS